MALRGPRRLLAAPGPTAGRSPGGPRHVWAHQGHAHIEVHGVFRGAVVSPRDGERLEKAVEAIDGVHWAAWNGVLRRLVVRFDDARVGVRDLVAVVQEAEREGVPLERIAGVPDVDETIGNAAGLAGDLLGVGAGLLGRVMGLPPVPGEFAAVTTAVEHLPGLRRFLDTRLGSARTELAVSLASSAVGAATETALTPLADAALRATLLGEAFAHRDAWHRRAADLHRDRESARAAPLLLIERPAPLPDGPIESYAQRMSTITMLAAAALVPFKAGRRRAARVIATGSPRPARLGREAYAARLGRVLAQRGVVVRDSTALRRLDRIDTVVVDAAVLVTSRTGLDPLAAELAAAARRVGRLVVAGTGSGLAERMRAEAVPGGSRLAASVRSLQADGHGVLLIAARNDTALAAADCGIGVLTPGRRPPWGAHLLCGPGLETAWLVLESAQLARQVSRRSARLALLGSVVGALLGLADARYAAGRRALFAGGVSALLAVAGGARAAGKLGRRPLPVPADLTPWHALAVDEVIATLDTSLAGLTDTQAAQRRRSWPAAGTTGPELDHAAGPDLLRATVAQLDTPLTAPLVAGAGISAATGATTDALLVGMVLLGNALLSGVQQVTADRALHRLLSAGALRARLRRAGRTRVAAADELVPGDVIMLEPGDAVPADCRIIHSAGLELDESTLTGESLPVDKNSAATFAAEVADRQSMLYAGTTVAAGTAAAVVVAVGRATEAGRGALAPGDEAPVTGVEARLRGMAAASVPAAAGAAGAILANGLLRGRFAESVSTSVALAVAAIPEGLPFVATAAQLAASKRLSRRNILVRDPRALEALGRVDVVCFDKTGTLTEGRIRLHTISDGRRALPVDQLDAGHREILAAALRASPVQDGDNALPHPTDRAVVTGSAAAGVLLGEGAPGWQLLRELPFEPGRGFHAVLGTVPGRQVISVKGAPETVLPRCRAWRRDGRSRPMSKADREEVEAAVERLARQGYRVLAVAQRAASARRHLDEDRVERLELLGLLGLTDPARATAAAAIRRLRRAGVDVIMLTGDHPSTAGAIAAELDLLDGRGVLAGSQIEGGDEALDAAVTKAAVFARVSPAQKVAIVHALHRAGRVVAVAGDGANDAPAIRLADVGIALGDQGAGAARQAADLIVVDGKIETIADGVIEGRALWSSVRDAVALLLGGNLGEALFAVGGALLTGAQPLNTRQILFVNLMTDLLPAIAVATRPPRNLTPEQLAREGPDASLGESLVRDVARRAVATTAAATGGWLVARVTGTRRRAGTVALASLVGAQLAQTAVAARGDPLVLATVAVSTAALVGVVQTPVVSTFFGSRPLGPIGWSIVAGASVAGAVLGAVPLRDPRG